MHVVGIIQVDRARKILQYIVSQILESAHECSSSITLFYVSVCTGDLRFLELETTTGVDTILLPAQDDGVSNAINIPIGFTLGNTTHTKVYVGSSLILLFRVA